MLHVLITCPFEMLNTCERPLKTSQSTTSSNVRSVSLEPNTDRLSQVADSMRLRTTGKTLGATQHGLPGNAITFVLHIQG